MHAELDHIADPGRTLVFAIGCLKTGVVQRLCDGSTRYLSGRAMVVLIGLICAAFHLGCAFSGIDVLRGGRLDPVVTRLVGDAPASATVATYLDVRPVMVLLIASLGITHVMVAWGIWRGKLRTFFTTWLIGTSLAIVLGGCILIFARSNSGIAIQLVGLMAEAAAVLWLIHPNLTVSRTAVRGE